MDEDKEYKAIGIVIGAINDLDSTQRERVIDYVLKRFGISKDLTVKTQDTTEGSTQHQHALHKAPDSKPASPISVGMDIKQLKETRKPNSDVQMAVLVAYYLKSIAPDELKKDAIGTNDINTYFTQASYPLPQGKNGSIDTLKNAKKSGYMESAGRGLYRLNPVGFNLAAYNMPTSGKANPKK